MVKENLLSLLDEQPSISTSGTCVVEQLCRVFNEVETSNSIVMYFRFVTSALLQQQRERFEAFLNVDEFCSFDAYLRATESMDRESDQMTIVVLNEWMQGKLRIFVLDNSPLQQAVSLGSEDGVGSELFVEFSPVDKRQAAIWVNLLYRPGHYDLFYPE